MHPWLQSPCWIGASPTPRAIQRADFYGQALANRGLADALQAGSVLLGPMTREELRGAIEAPARTRGVAFEPGLVDRIVGEIVEEPGCLPLLEFTLSLLWNQQQARQLTHQAYEDLGGVEGALARYADQVFDDLDEAGRARARRVFVQMVKPGEATEDTRRLATRTDLDPVDWTLVQRLADERLVVTDRDPAGRETAEVVHEALIRAWPRLQSWMDEDREFRTWQERARDAMEVWRASGGDHDGRDPELLLRGSVLEQARRWLADRPGQLHTTLVDFIELSERTQQRRLSRDRRRVRLLGFFLVMALGLAGFAGVQLNRRDSRPDSPCHGSSPRRPSPTSTPIFLGPSCSAWQRSAWRTRPRRAARSSLACSPAHNLSPTAHCPDAGEHRLQPERVDAGGRERGRHGAAMGSPHAPPAGTTADRPPRVGRQRGLQP